MSELPIEMTTFVTNKSASIAHLRLMFDAGGFIIRVIMWRMSTPVLLSMTGYGLVLEGYDFPPYFLAVLIQ